VAEENLIITVFILDWPPLGQREEVQLLQNEAERGQLAALRIKEAEDRWASSSS
jgi:hypothetical protein